MEIRISHQLTIEQARSAAERIAGDLQRQYGGSWQWLDDHAITYQHQLIAGTLTISNSEAHIGLAIGPGARLFASTIKQRVADEMSKRFNEAANLTPD